MVSSMHEQLTEAAGWIGVVCILGAYGALSFGYLDATSLWYHGINLVGGVGIIIDAVSDKNYQPQQCLDPFMHCLLKKSEVLF
jgi:hypothetical protein